MQTSTQPPSSRLKGSSEGSNTVAPTPAAATPISTAARHIATAPSRSRAYQYGVRTFFVADKQLGHSRLCAAQGWAGDGSNATVSSKLLMAGWRALRVLAEALSLALTAWATWALSSPLMRHLRA